VAKGHQQKATAYSLNRKKAKKGQTLIHKLLIAYRLKLMAHYNDARSANVVRRTNDARSANDNGRINIIFRPEHPNNLVEKHKVDT
jgi:hypothetical protein